MFFLVSTFLTSVNSLSCISLANKKCIVRPGTVIYPLSIKTSKCSGSCDNINDPYARICVADAVKGLNVKVLNLMSRANERRHKMAWNV